MPNANENISVETAAAFSTATTPSASVAFAPIKGQPEVTSFFQKALKANNLSHAYLFVGPSEDVQQQTARNIAKALVAQDILGKSGSDDLVMIDAGTHPDVREYEPASAVGYLAEQITELIESIQLAPVRAGHKVFVLQKADRLGPKTANALLKTLEEPPADAIFILQTSSQGAVLPTIRSRSQVVRFKPEDFSQLSRELNGETGVSVESAFAALSVAGSYEAAKAYALDESAQKARHLLISTVASMNTKTAWQLLKIAKQLSALVGAASSASSSAASSAAAAAGAEADGLTAPEREAQENLEKEFLSTKAQKEREKQRKREVRANAHNRLVQLLCAGELFLRDVLVVQEQGGVQSTVAQTQHQPAAAAQSQPQLAAPQPLSFSQPDTLNEAQQAASLMSSRQVVQGIRLVQETLRDVQQNVSARLAIEAMLLHLEDVLCQK